MRNQSKTHDNSTYSGPVSFRSIYRWCMGIAEGSQPQIARIFTSQQKIDTSTELWSYRNYMWHKLTRNTFVRVADIFWKRALWLIAVFQEMGSNVVCNWIWVDISLQVLNRDEVKFCCKSIAAISIRTYGIHLIKRIDGDKKHIKQTSQKDCLPI